MENLRELVKLYEANYDVVTFPLMYATGFQFKGGRIFNEFSPDGLTYTLYRLMNWENPHKWVDRKRARELYNSGQHREFVKYLNRCRRWQETEAVRHREEELIAAYINEERTNETLYGLMTAYNNVSNQDVLSFIDDAALGGHMTGYRITPTAMNLYFRTGFHGTFQWGLNVRNGETGHTTLGYHFFLETGDGAWWSSVPSQSVKRHLSAVGETISDMKDILEASRELEMQNALVAHKWGEFAGLFTNAKWDKLELDNFPHDTPVISVMSSLGEHLGRYGKKTLASKALDILFAKVSELVFKGV